MKQEQYLPVGRGHPFDELDKPLPAILPGLPGGPPLLPSEREVPAGQEGELTIFDGDDVVQGYKLYRQFSDGAVDDTMRIEGIRAVMMYALQIAAVNLGVPMGSNIPG